ncbi:diaminopimelate decarboxylase [soil metagenome]
MLWPETADRNASGELSIGGVALTCLADQYGTPLYVFDEATVRLRAQSAVADVQAAHPEAEAVFAAKALSIPAILSIIHEAGMGIDVVSAGELYVALKSGIPASAVTLHGNNKGKDELRAAIDAGVGLIAVDNFYELDLLEQLAGGRSGSVEILIRLNPGIDVHTHGKIATGVTDSKFGFPLWTGDAMAAVERAQSIAGLSLAGYHVHLGSQLFDLNAPALAMTLIVDFAANVYQRLGVSPRVVSPGGGMGIAYDAGAPEADLREWAMRTVAALTAGCQRHALTVPRVIFEPGRSIVGQAGVAVYRVGSRKEIPGVRTYISVDGGMADNIRPALYEARYTAEIANRKGNNDNREIVTIAGRYCESGDVLISEIELPRLAPGDLLAMPATGAYCIPLASNYNMSPRPAVIVVNDGQSRLVRRRETFEDLLATSVF